MVSELRGARLREARSGALSCCIPGCLIGSGVFRALGGVGERVWSGFGRPAEVSVALVKLLVAFLLGFGVVLVVFEGKSTKYARNSSQDARNYTNNARKSQHPARTNGTPQPYFLYTTGFAKTTRPEIPVQKAYKMRTTPGKRRTS